MTTQPDQPNLPHSDAVEADSSHQLKQRRAAIQSAGGLAAFGFGLALPEKWVAPVVDTVILPSHAQSSPAGGSDINPAACGRAANSDPTLCCDDLDPGSAQYAEECCDQPARNASGDYLRDGDGRVRCCEGMDPAESGYSEYCCKKRVSKGGGQSVCCDDLNVDDPDYQQYCCENKARNAAGQPVLDGSGNSVCCEGSNKDPDYCCIKSTQSFQRTISRRRTTWKSGVSGVPELQVPQWDPANGPLDKVVIETSSQIDFEVSLENIDASASGIDVTITADAKVKLTGPNGLEVTLRSPEVNQSTHMPHGDEDPFNPLPTPFNPGGGSSVLILDDLGGSDSQQIVVSDAAELATFIGTGELSFSGDSWADNSISADSGAGSGNVFSLVETFSDLTVRVSYMCAASDA